MFPRDANGKLLFDTDVDLLETWRAMEGLVEDNLTKAIGLSNFNSKQIKRIYDAAAIKPANLQVKIRRQKTAKKAQNIKKNPKA